MRLCLGADALFYTGGGHVWAYLNWALALRRLGCQVLWLESGREDEGPALRAQVAALEHVLAPYGFGQALILDTAGPLPHDCAARPVEAAIDADLFIDLAYTAPEVVRRFRRSVLIDTDPGVTQRWWAGGELDLSGYDAYFTVGEGVAGGLAAVPDCGVSWRHTPPCVDLEAWPACPPELDGSFWTTVTHWWNNWEEVDGEDVENSKRAGFEPLLQLPTEVDAPLELAVGGLDDEDERRLLERSGWRLSDADQITRTPELHRSYIQHSRGEFSAAKPLYVRQRTGWLSDRTVSYLASGRPAVVQDTGASSIDGQEGLLTFGDLRQARAALDRVERAYEKHCRVARELAESRYAGDVVAPALLADALT